MEAQFTIRDTLENFQGWVKSYGAARMGWYGSGSGGYSGWDTGMASEYLGWEWEAAVYVLHHYAPVKDGSVAFRIRVAEAERLEVRALTHLAQGNASLEERRERQTELDAYLTEFVRAIRWKWTDEPGLNELERFYLKAVRERPAERGKLEDYCDRVGITDQTLRNWEKKFQAIGIETKRTE